MLEVEQYITQNYDKELSIREIAQRVFVTPNYLCYLYKKNTKRTLNQLILDTKMKKARKFVCETNMKFGEIADPATMYLSDVFTISINIAGNGGMSVPCGLGAQSGMPVGVQLIAPQFKDENMFRAAMALEAAYGKAPVAPNFADGKVVE